jgi:hypothetical protein
MDGDKTATEILRSAEERIEWVLSNPDISEWLKHALHGAMDRDPVDLLNELEILNALLRPKCQCLIETSYSWSIAGPRNSY